LELRQVRHGAGAIDNEGVVHAGERLLQVGVHQRHMGVLLELEGGRLVHQPLRPSPMAGPSAIPARTSATWRDFTRAPRRASLPAMFSRHPRSPASSVPPSLPPARVFSMSAALSVTMLSEISGYLMQKVPPKPQQTSAPGSSFSSSPSTLC